jgi:hypothetical protein
MLLMLFTVYHAQAISSKLASRFTKCGGEPIPGEAMRSSQTDRTHRRQKELGSITPPSL